MLDFLATGLVCREFCVGVCLGFAWPTCSFTRIPMYSRRNNSIQFPAHEHLAARIVFLFFFLSKSTSVSDLFRNDLLTIKAKAILRKTNVESILKQVPFRTYLLV